MPNKTGDGASQPVESVSALDDLANSLIPEAGEAEEEGEQRSAPEGEETDEGREVDQSEQEEEESEEQAEADPTVKLKHDGKEVEMKLSEAISLAQQGLDYTKKTMAVADERKAVDAERKQAEDHRKQTEAIYKDASARLEAFGKYLQQQLGNPPDRSLLHQDASAYLLAKEEYESRKGQLQQVFDAQKQVEQEQARHRQAWIADRVTATEKALRGTLKDFGDTTIPDLAKYAEGFGLTPQTADMAILEPGFWQVIEKAKAFDAIQQRKAEMKPVAKLTKVAKPTAQNVTSKQIDRAKRESAFKKNPSVDALADFLTL